MSQSSQVFTVRMGEPMYDELLDPVRADTALLAQMWADAESRLDEGPGKTWCIATVPVGGRRVAAAWAAAVEIEHDGERTLKCCNNYEVPSWRGHGLYEAAYRARHRDVVQPSGLRAVTYIFAQPVPLHEADGWVVTGSGISREDGIEPHRWYEMRRQPTSLTRGGRPQRRD